MQVVFRGISGSDTLVGPAVDSTWTITDSDTGALNEHLHFSSVEHLVGAAGNEDTFVLNPSAHVSGRVDGGDGGFDTLVLAGGSFDAVRYIASAPDAGTIARDSDLLHYAGLEPITDNTVTVDRRIELTGEDNKATLSENAAGMLTVSDDDGTPGTFEEITFAKPSNSLTIDLAVVAGDGVTDDGNDQITINSVDLGDASLTILAETIQVTPGAVVQSTGDITLLAKKTGIKQLEDLGPLNFNSKVATIDVGAGAEIRGQNLIIRAEAADKAFTSLLGTKELPSELFIDPLIDDITGLLDLPIKVLFKESDARVTVNEDVVLAGTGGVTVESDAIADANGGGAADTATSVRFPVKARSKLFSVGYVQTKATAIVDIKAGVNITADEAVVINSDGTSTALVKTETNRDLGDFPADPLKISFSLAIAKTDIISQTSVAEGATITAGKTANITAGGLEDAEAEAETGLYNDGRAGISLGLSFSNATIDTDMNGTVTADMDPGSVVKFQFDPTVTDSSAIGFVDTAANTIKVGEHALATGDKVTYSNRRGTSIAGPLPGGLEGLTDGDVAFVITTSDPTKIQLAETRDKAIAGDEIALGTGAAVNSKSFEASAVDSAKDTIKLDNPALTGTGIDFSVLGSTFELGQAVRYDAGGGTPIAGLVDGQTYFVIASTNQFNLQGDLRFVDEQVIQLAESGNEARAGIALDLDATNATGNHTLTAFHVLDSGLTTGIGVIASLDTTDKATAEAGIKIEGDDDDEDDDGLFDSSILDRLFDVLSTDYNDNADKPESGASSTADLQLAAALAFTKTNHTVTADVGPNAVLKSNEDLEVAAKISEALQVNASSSIESPEGDDAAGNTFSTAIIVGLIDNTAQATVASGAQLDALRATRVISDVSYPYLTRPDEFIPANLGEIVDLLENEGRDAVSDYLDGTLGLSFQAVQHMGEQFRRGRRNVDCRLDQLSEIQ